MAVMITLVLSWLSVGYVVVSGELTQYPQETQIWYFFCVVALTLLTGVGVLAEVDKGVNV